MAYRILKTPTFDKQMMKLDLSARKQIADYIEDVIEKLEKPKTIAKPLTGNLKGLYRYRIGSYRIICEIIDNEITIIFILVGHRKNVYSLMSNKKKIGYAN